MRDAARAHAQALEDTKPVKALFDAALAVRLNLVQPPDSPEDAMIFGQSEELQNEIAQYQAVHLPYRFPEVFLRDNAGFDVLVGNPPWEKIRHEPHQFWVIRDPGLRALKGKKRDDRIAWLRNNRPQEAAEEEEEAERREALKDLLSCGYTLQKSQHYDFAKVFAERNLALVRPGGAVGVVLPQALLVLGGWAPIREVMIRDWHLTTLPLRNRGEWLFDKVHPQLTVCLVSLSKGEGVTVHAAADSLTGFIAEQQRPGLTMTVADVAALSDDLNVPWFEHADDPAIFNQMARLAHLGSGTGWITGTADSTRWDFSGSGKHKAYATERDSAGAWRVTMTRHVDMYALTDDPEGKRIPRPQNLIGDKAGISLVRGQVVLDKKHPPLVFRFPTNNDNSRTLIATALPMSGWLYSKGYAHGVRMVPETEPRDILALLGYLNSVPADWWARRFVDRHLGKRIIDGLPLPDWTEQQREQVAARVATLLRRNGYTNLAGGRPLPLAVDGAPDSDTVRAQIDAYAFAGLGLSPTQANTIFFDFEDSKDGVPALHRTIILTVLATMKETTS